MIERAKSDNTADLVTGWYPALICWDPQEGCFPAGAFWDGAAWHPYPHNGPVCEYWPKRFETREAAQAFAYDHDPDY